VADLDSSFGRAAREEIADALARILSADALVAA
jgi:hypothetical protein